MMLVLSVTSKEGCSHLALLLIADFATSSDACAIGVFLCCCHAGWGAESAHRLRIPMVIWGQWDAFALCRNLFKLDEEEPGPMSMH
jgi:hypothetical protein